MRNSALYFLTAVTFAMSASAPVQSQVSPNWRQCVNEGEVFAPEVAIRSCTVLIESASETRSNWAIAFYNRGNAFRARGDYDRAIADYTNAAEINPKDANPFYARGDAYDRIGVFDRAIADYTKAIELNPKDGDAYYSRGTVHDRKGEDKRAMADYAKAIELDPKNADWVYTLGVAKFEKGDFQGAAANLLRSVDLTNDLYAILLRYLARARAGETSALAELQARAGRPNAKNWPYAMIEFYLGRRTPEQALAAAGNPDQYCQAQFYIGQWHLVKGNAALAAAPLQAAIATCPKDFIEFTGAVAELKRMQPQKTTDTALAAKR